MFGLGLKTEHIKHNLLLVLDTNMTIHNHSVVIFILKQGGTKYLACMLHGMYVQLIG